jgi:flagellar basal body rod protein FlgG
MTISTNFTNLTDHLAKGAINFSTDSFKTMLVSVAPTESELDTWVNRSSVANEVVGTGYTSGGVALTLTVGAVDTTNNRTAITATNLSPGWTVATITAVGEIIYKSTGSAATDKLVCYKDFGGTVTSTAGNFNTTYATPLYINR